MTLTIHTLTEQDHSYKVGYEMEDNDHFTKVEMSIPKKSLLQYIIDASLNMFEYWDGFKEDMVQTYTDPLSVLLNDDERVVRLYLLDNLS